MKQEKLVDFSTILASGKSDSKFNNITRDMNRKSVELANETRCKRDRIWSRLANQVVGSEHFKE